jgi:enoyl-CoA hydratase
MKLIDQIGYTAAMDLLLTGRFIDAEHAEKVGLVTETCELSDVWPRALARAELVVAASPRALRAAKQAALGARTARYAAQEEDERRIATALWATGDVKTGAAAFLAKRAPVYADE